jgi:hypothetical protein
MIPYIVALVFLIVIILYQVYASEESFTAASYADLYRERYGITTQDASGNPLVSRRDASGNPIVVSKDASGNEIRLSLSDLFGLLGPFKTKTTPESKPAPTAPEKETPPVTSSTTGSLKEIEDRIAKTVSKQVKDDLMSQRSTEAVFDKYAPCDLTDSEAQGQEFQKGYPRHSREPDMSEYIRKDSIPCWNCSIP